MDTNAESAVDQLSEIDHESSAASHLDSSGLAKEAEDHFSVGNCIEGVRVDASPTLQTMVGKLDSVRIALHASLAENSARLKVFENFRAAVDASVMKVSQRGETLNEILLDVGNVLDTFNNTEEIPGNMEDIMLGVFESYANLREKNHKVDESLFLIAEVNQVVAERKNTRVYIKRFCDFLRGTVLEPLPKFREPLSNGAPEDTRIDLLSHEDNYISVADKDEDNDANDDDYDDGYCDSNSSDGSISDTNGASGKFNLVRTVCEDEALTLAQYENCAVAFRKMGHKFRSLSSKASSNSGIARALASPGENHALWFLDSMWYPSSRSAARDLERLKSVSGKTYQLKELFGHLTEECLAYVDLSCLERLGTVYKGNADKKFLDFITKFVMKNYFVPTSLRQLHLSIPPLTSLAQLEPLHPGLYRGLELHLHFPCLSNTEVDGKWMMDVCRKLVKKFPCELRDVRGFYFKHCRLSEQQIKDFMKFLDGEFPKTKIVCVDCDQQPHETCDRQQRLYAAMGFTFYDKAEDGLMNLKS